MKLWLDDVRPAPTGYIWAKSVNSAKIHCTQFLGPGKILFIEEFSLDHDAGDWTFAGGDYIEFLKWLEERQKYQGWKIKAVFKIHSINPVGVENMRAIIKHNHWRLGN